MPNVAEIVTPTCPVCAAPPVAGMTFGGGTQAFCSGGDDCRVLMWNPSLTATENLAQGTTVDLLASDAPDEPPAPDPLLGGSGASE